MDDAPGGAPESAPDWDAFPNLDDVLKKADVDTKGTGSYAASYVNWCKAAQLLRKHAKGWQFELRHTLDPQGNDTDVFRAPNGTGYLKGFFRAPTGSGFCDTPDWPQAIMNNRNQPVQWDAITARDVTDTHRRCMCTAAAAHFGLAWQLWAKVDIENPMREEAEPAPEPTQSRAARPRKTASSKKADIPPTQGESTATAGEPSLKEQVGVIIRPLFIEAGGMAVFNEWRAQYKQQFNPSVNENLLTGEHIQTQEQFDWTKTFLDDIIKRKSNPQ